MEDKRAALADRARALIGDGYIYGAKGQTCSEAFRRGQAEQYGEYASIILTTGAKWDGKRVWDCAQLTRECARAAGETLVSGATSQWLKTAWARKGTIDSLPPEPCQLFRGTETKMEHTGVHLGDGTAVDARGTASGVVVGPVSGYPWTHWASLWAEDIGPEEEGITKCVMGARLALRASPDPGAKRLLWMPPGASVTVLRTVDDTWSQVTHEGQTGYCMSRYLGTNDLRTVLETVIAMLQDLLKGE